MLHIQIILLLLSVHSFVTSSPSGDQFDHAPWRFNRNGSLSPEIYESKALDLLKTYNAQRFILSACDFVYFERYCRNLVDYENSTCQIPYVLGVYSSSIDSGLIFEKLRVFSEENNLKKFYPFVYGNSNLEWILNQQKDSEIRWDYKINYIRSSRYSLILKVWSAVGISVLGDCSIGSSSTYVIDFDNEIRGDLNHAIKKNYSSQSLVLSWDSKKCPNKNFTETLSSSTVNFDSCSIQHPYKVIKAGFAVISPSVVSLRFLQLFECYSIGDVDSAVFIRLFSFYFSDQVAMLLAIRDVLLNSDFKQKISWIDLHVSSIVSTNSSLAEFMWCPKKS